MVKLLVGRAGPALRRENMRGVEVQLKSYFVSALVGGEGSAKRSSRFYRRGEKGPMYSLNMRLVFPRAGLEPGYLGRPAKGKGTVDPVTDHEGPEEE